ncbi:hypothetical protein D3C87_1741720 [compost metagenome]
MFVVLFADQQHAVEFGDDEAVETVDDHQLVFRCFDDRVCRVMQDQVAVRYIQVGILFRYFIH